MFTRKRGSCTLGEVVAEQLVKRYDTDPKGAVKATAELFGDRFFVPMARNSQQMSYESAFRKSVRQAARS